MSDFVPVTVKLPEDLKREVDEVAPPENLQRSEWVREAIQEKLDREER